MLPNICRSQGYFNFFFYLFGFHSESFVLSSHKICSFRLILNIRNIVCLLVRCIIDAVHAGCWQFQAEGTGQVRQDHGHWGQPSQRRSSDCPAAHRRIGWTWWPNLEDRLRHRICHEVSTLLWKTWPSQRELYRNVSYQCVLHLVSISYLIYLITPSVLCSIVHHMPKGATGTITFQTGYAL